MNRTHFCLCVALTFLIKVTCHALPSVEPWFTGSLLAFPAYNVAPGHVEIDLLGFESISNSFYNNHSIVTNTIPFKSQQLLPSIMYGLTKDIDVEWDLLYVINRTEDKVAENFGDTTIVLGFQLLNQDAHHATPDLKMLIMEILPSGKYDRLDPAKNGTDAIGMGSFQTEVGFTTQKLYLISGEHYLNMFASMGYLYASSIYLNGLNTYGGNPLLKGTIKPGNLFTFDLAGELNLTKHWVAVLEGYCQYMSRSKFKGDFGNLTSRLSAKSTSRFSHLLPSRHNLGNSSIGNDSTNVFSLAPAIEYNFSKNYGIIAGTWFTISGMNTPKFFAPALMFTASW